MGIGMWELLIILAIVLVIFGAKRLRGLGGDLGGAIKSFKEAMKSEEGKPDEAAKSGAEAKPLESRSGKVVEGEVVSRPSSERQKKV